MYLELIDEKILEVFEQYDKPFYVYLSLSNLCNANCIFCDVRSNKKKKNILEVNKLIDELSKMGTKYIHFTGGGEPFIDDEIFSYLDYCTKKDIKINIITNGLNLNEEKIERLSLYNIKNIFVSIDSYNPKIHNELRRTDEIWEKATQNINLLKEYLPNIKIILNHVINSKNIDDFDKFINMKQKVNFDYINPIIIKDYNILFPTESQIENYNNKIEIFKKLAQENNVKFLCNNINFFDTKVTINGDRSSKENLKCIFPHFCSFIDCSTGDVFPCDCSMHRDRTIYNIGNLKTESFEEVWNSPKKKILSKQLLHGNLNCKLKCDEANCLFNDKYFESRR